MKGLVVSNSLIENLVERLVNLEEIVAKIQSSHNAVAQLVPGQKKAITYEIARRYQQKNSHIKVRVVSAHEIEIKNQSGLTRRIKHHCSAPKGSGAKENGWYSVNVNDLNQTERVGAFVFSEVVPITNELLTYHFTVDELQQLAKSKKISRGRYHWYFGRDDQGNHGEFRDGPSTGLDYAFERWALPSELIT